LTQISKVTHLIVITNPHCANEVNRFKANNRGISVLLMNEVEELGESTTVEFIPPKAQDLAVIMYTSGSTGNPKGVMMSHLNILTSIESFSTRVDFRAGKDIYIAYLPLAHILELVLELCTLFNGVRLGYSSAQTMVDSSTAIKNGQKGDIRILKPTIMATVPLILERLCKTVNDKISKRSWFTQALFKKLYAYKLDACRAGRKSFLLDRILFRRLNRAVLGGKVKYMVCGSALLSKEVQEFVQVCLSGVKQGYGLTETCAGGTTQMPYETNTMEVGSVISACEIRLVDWDEPGYRCTDKPNPRGEIHIGGDTVAIGYYNLPEKTKEDFYYHNGVRYFATGDIGEILPNGNIKIIDRKKDLIKLHGGEYVSLNNVETCLKLMPLIDNCCTYAKPFETYVIGLICANQRKIIVR
jgi:long-chain acyl-CoA synthetase